MVNAYWNTFVFLKIILEWFLLFNSYLSMLYSIHYKDVMSSIVVITAQTIAKRIWRQKSKLTIQKVNKSLAYLKESCNRNRIFLGNIADRIKKTKHTMFIKIRWKLYNIVKLLCDSLSPDESHRKIDFNGLICW